MRALGMGENLPAGVARQWARWGRHPEHLFSECSEGERERYLRLGFPIRCYRFTDDNFAPRMAVEQLVGFYRGAATEVITHAPAELGASAIGHFGWSKPPFRDTLWREMADWLHSRADAVSSRRGEAHLPTRLLEPPARLDVEAGAKRGVQRPSEDSSPHPR
jgi:predicted alpha/beta hydrolase